MESSRNVKKLKARQKCWKRSSVVIILKGDRERMRSLKSVIDGLDTGRSYKSAVSSSSDSHVLAIGSDIAVTISDNKDKYSTVLMGIFLVLLDICMLKTTFPWRFDEDLSLPALQSRLFELVILLISYWIMLPDIYKLVKNRRFLQRMPFLDKKKFWAGLVSGCGFHLCICSTVQFANFHQHENVDRNANILIRLLCCLCLLDCRRSIASGYKLQLPCMAYMINEAFTPQWLCLIGNILFAVLPFMVYRPILRSDPDYAYYVMGSAILNLIYSIAGLWFKGQQERVKSRRWGMVWWFYHPDPDSRPFGTLPDIYGLICAIYQFVVSVVHYVCLRLHIDNPIQLCLLPTIFLVCLACSTSHRSHGTKGILLINIGLEITSAAFEQLSSSSKPRYALYAMLLAITAFIISIWELVDKGKKENVKLMNRGTVVPLWWFYHRAPPYTPFGSLPDIYGLICGIAQCIFSTVQYVCYLWHVDNPTQQLCLLPSIFYICAGVVVLSKAIRKSKIY